MIAIKYRACESSAMREVELLGGDSCATSTSSSKSNIRFC